jgi:hypothetical protein
MNSISRSLKGQLTLVVLTLSLHATAQPDADEVMPTPRMANGQIYLGLSPEQTGFWGSSGRIFDRRGRAHQTNLMTEDLPLQPWAR